MQSLIWALGSMVILIILLTFLPLGFTLKGKFFVSIAAFILALGGLAAGTTFPLWQTALMLAVLTFFTAYIMGGRSGYALFKETQSVVGDLNEEVKPFDQNFKIEKNIDDSLLDLNDMAASETSNKQVDKHMGSTMILDKTELALKEGSTDDFLGEDISFLLERNRELENEDKALENDLGYLSDIESMFNEKSIELKEDFNPSWLEELDDLSSITLDSVTDSDKKLGSDIMLAVKEAAAANDQLKGKKLE